MSATREIKLHAKAPAIPPVLPSARRFPERASLISQSHRPSEIFGAILANSSLPPAGRSCSPQQTIAAATASDRRDRSPGADAPNLQRGCALRYPPHLERTIGRGSV